MKRSAPCLMLTLLVSLPVQAQTSPAPDTDAEMPLPAFLQDHPDAVLRKKAMQRFLYNYRARVNPDGSLPEAPGPRVTPQLNALAAAPQVPLVLNSRWQSIGPLPITGGQVGNTLTSRPMSGRVASIDVHPTNPNRWIVGTAGGGVWETRDGGVNFVALTDNAPTLAIGAVAYAPSAGTTIYVGTGESTFSAVSFGGEGVLKSVDGGVNWQQLGTSTFTKGTAFSEIRVDPGNANTLVAATTTGVFGRPPTFAPGSGAPGLWRSTDGGVSWTRTLALDGMSLVARPGNFSQMYAGLGNGATTANAVYRSNDGGVAWAPVPGPWTSITGNTARVEVVLAPSNPNRAYVAVTNRATAGMYGLWTTTNAWDPTPTWTQISLAATDNGTGNFGPCGFDKAFNSISAQCWYNLTLTVKPTDENILFFGGIPMWRYNLTSGTWVEVSQTAAPANRENGIHVDQHASAWAGTRLIVGNDGGVWSTTTDGDGVWTSHNATIATAQYYEGSVMSDGSYQLAGSQDNGTHRRSGANAWPLVFGGDGAGNLSSTASNFAVSSQNQNVARTTNGGVTFTSVRGNYGGVAPFIGKMRECPSSPGTVILNGSRVNRTTQFYTGLASLLWTNSGSPIFADAAAGSSIAFGMDCNTIAAGHSNGQILITANGDITAAGMINRDPGNQVPNRPISSIAFDPKPAAAGKRVCVGLTGFAGGAPANLFCTDDFTAATPTWVNRSLPVDIPVNALVFDPTVPDRVYAGADYGVWVSSDGGGSWAWWGPGVGMPNVAVFDLVHAGGKLYAFTHGRGAFMLSNFDLNSDSSVTCADVSIVRAAMGKRVGSVGFNAVADLNGDNQINIRDLTMITRQLPAGTSCS
jgi:Dockerin type I domain